MPDDSSLTRISDRCKSWKSLPACPTSEPYRGCFTVCHCKDSNVTFDGALFYIHRKNLEAHTLGFPPSEFDALDEIVPLTEDSSTFNVLFQFIYLQRPPDLQPIPTKPFTSLAEAAEKYQVFYAMSICIIHMRYDLLRVL
jgi:hypothetical protein